MTIPIDLDLHRETAARQAADLRRLRVEFERDQDALRAKRADLEKFLVAAPARQWSEVVEKTRYLLQLFADSSAADDPRRQQLIGAVLADFDRLLNSSPQDNAET